MSFFLAYKVPYERSRPGRGGRLRQPHRARRVDLDVDVVELAADHGGAAAARPRAARRPQELPRARRGAPSPATSASRRRHALAEDRLAAKHARQPGEAKKAGMAFAGVGRRPGRRAPFPAVRCARRVGAAPRAPAFFGAAAGRASRPSAPAFARLAGSRASLARRAAAGGRPVPSRAPPPPRRRRGRRRRPAASSRCRGDVARLGARPVVEVHELGVLDGGGVLGAAGARGGYGRDGGEEREGRLPRSRLRLGRRVVDRGDVPGAWGSLRRRDGAQGYYESDQH